MCGGACAKCGANNDLKPLAFHHETYPEGYKKQKSGIAYKVWVSSEDKFWDVVIPEVRDHCVLLCLSCHMAEHRRLKKEK